MTSLPEVLSTHWLVIILHSWVWTWNPYINILLQASPVRQHHFRIRVALTGGHHKVFYRRTRCWRYNKTDSGFNNWIDEWLSLWIGFIYSQGSMDRYLKILLGPRPVRGSWKFLGPRTTTFVWLVRSAFIKISPLSKFSVCGSLFTVLLRSLGQLSVYKSMKLEIEELKRRENFLDKKWDI